MAAGGAVLLAAVVLVVLLVVLLPSGRHTPVPSAGPTALPAPSSEAFGANVNLLFNSQTYTASQIRTQLQALRATGATIARSDTLWEVTEPAPPTGGVHHYLWGFDDRIAGALAAAGLRWFPIIDYAPGWASADPARLHAPPRAPREYAAFAAAVAARYGPGGAFWRLHRGLAPQPVDTYEIWNEPDNVTFFPPAPDLRVYAAMYLDARAAIKAVDPLARVIIGGLTAPGKTLPTMLDDVPALRGHIDGVAVHPYRPDPAAVLGAVRSDRMSLRSLGLGGVPLYVTEFGWTTSPPRSLSWLPERLRPGYIEQTLAALGHVDCGVAAALIYTWVSPERDPADHEEWFGIHPPGGGVSPDTDAFAAGLRAAAEPRAALALCG